MKIVDIKSLPIIILTIIFIAGCTSPVDLQTPKKITPLGSVQRIQPKIDTIYIEQNGISMPFLTQDASVQLDTAFNPPIVWMHLSLNAFSQDNINSGRMAISTVEFYCDSLQLSGKPYYYYGDGYSSSDWAKFKVTRGINDSSLDTTLCAGDQRNSAEMTFTTDKQKGELWSVFYTKLYNFSFRNVNRDTMVQKAVTKYFYDTTWVNGSPLIHKVVQQDTQQIKVTLTEQVRSTDSLFLNGKIKFKY